MHSIESRRLFPTLNQPPPRLLKPLWEFVAETRAKRILHAFVQISNYAMAMEMRRGITRLDNYLQTRVESRSANQEKKHHEIEHRTAKLIVASQQLRQRFSNKHHRIADFVRKQGGAAATAFVAIFM